MNNNPVEEVGLVSGPIARNQERKGTPNKHSRLMKAKTHKKVLADSNRVSFKYSSDASKCQTLTPKLSIEKLI